MQLQGIVGLIIGGLIIGGLIIDDYWRTLPYRENPVFAILKAEAIDSAANMAAATPDKESYTAHFAYSVCDSHGFTSQIRTRFTRLPAC